MNHSQSETKEHYNNGIQLYLSKLYDRALEKFELALDSDWLFFFAHLWKAKTLIKLERYDKAIQYFDTHIKSFRHHRRGHYFLQFCITLIEEKYYEKALEIASSESASYTGKQFLDYLFVQLANNKKQEVTHQLLNISYEDKNELKEAYNYIINNEVLPKTIYEEITKDNVVPRYIHLSRKIKVLEKLKLQHRDYKNRLRLFKSMVVEIKENPDCNYSNKLQQSEEALEKIEEIFLKEGNFLIKKKELFKAKKIYSTLKNIDSKIKGLEVFQQNISGLQIKKGKKIAIIAILAILAFGLIKYQISLSLERSNLRTYAIEVDSIEVYDSYINKYGDHDKIHKLRESKLYKIALKTNKSFDINQLTSQYPNSKYLKTIVWNVKNGMNAKIKVFGTNSEQSEVTSKIKNQYPLPVGCNVGFSISDSSKIPLTKYFRVAKSLDIYEKLEDVPSLLLKETFQKNTRQWNTFARRKKIYRKLRKQEVQLKKGTLEFTNESYNDFIQSMIPIKELTKNIDFDIEVKVQKDGRNNGTYLLFGANEKEFNYIGISNNRKFQYGYKSFDGKKEKWVKESGWWRYNKNIRSGNLEYNIIRVTKKDNYVMYYINSELVGSTSLKNWYGNKVGFGVGANTKALISDLSIYQNYNYKKIEFSKDSIYYCWTQELNVRRKSNNGKIITTIKRGDPVKYLGKKGNRIVSATFEGIFSPEYYYEVELLNGTKGWVHGGALRSLRTSKHIEFSEFKLDL